MYAPQSGLINTERALGRTSWGAAQRGSRPHLVPRRTSLRGRRRRRSAGVFHRREEEDERQGSPTHGVEIPDEPDSGEATEEHDGESGSESRDLRGRVRCLAHAVIVWPETNSWSSIDDLRRWMAAVFWMVPMSLSCPCGGVSCTGSATCDFRVYGYAP